MYIPPLRTILLQIPKTGTQTMTAAMNAAHGECPQRGHMTIGKHRMVCHKKQMPVDREIAVIREPVARFVSGLSYQFDADETLDQAMTFAADRWTAARVFEPQSEYVDADVELWPFERLAELLRSLGAQDVPHKNASRRKWSADEVMAHPLWRRIEPRLVQDAKLYERAQ